MLALFPIRSVILMVFASNVQVSQDDSRGPAAEEEEDASLAGALARALMQREKAIHGTMCVE